MTTNFELILPRAAQMTPKRTTLYYTKRKQTEMKKNILNKKKAFEILDLSSISKAFFLAGAGGLEPATHGFGENLFEFEVAI